MWWGPQKQDLVCVFEESLTLGFHPRMCRTNDGAACVGTRHRATKLCSAQPGSLARKEGNQPLTSVKALSPILNRAAEFVAPVC